MRNAGNIVCRNHKEIGHIEDPMYKEEIILPWILDQQSVKMESELIWMRLQYKGKSLLIG